MSPLLQVRKCRKKSFGNEKKKLYTYDELLQGEVAYKFSGLSQMCHMHVPIIAHNISLITQPYFTCHCYFAKHIAWCQTFDYWCIPSTMVLIAT